MVNHWYLNDLKEEFSDVKNKIDIVIEANYEKNMLTKPNYGAWIFALTNHHKRTNNRSFNENKNEHKVVSIEELTYDEDIE